ncbi:hypothetical protein C8F04DRAFT_1113867, partial [Mycena alexandri]
WGEGSRESTGTGNSRGFAAACGGVWFSDGGRRQWSRMHTSGMRAGVYRQHPLQHDGSGCGDVISSAGHYHTYQAALVVPLGCAFVYLESVRGLEVIAFSGRRNSSAQTRRHLYRAGTGCRVFLLTVVALHCALGYLWSSCLHTLVSGANGADTGDGCAYHGDIFSAGSPFSVSSFSWVVRFHHYDHRSFVGPPPKHSLYRKWC